MIPTAQPSPSWLGRGQYGCDGEGQTPISDRGLLPMFSRGTAGPPGPGEPVACT
jgi:hypothetical protein